MASTYETLNRFEEMADGEKNNTWGQITNVNIDLFSELVSGMESIATTGGTTTLTTNNGASDQARNMILKITGTLVSNATIRLPAKSHRYIVWNATSGAYTVSVDVSGGTPVTILQGAKVDIFTDGTDCYLVNIDNLRNNVAGNGYVLSDFEEKDVAGSVYSLGNISGAVAIDYTNGSYQYGTATGNISSITISNWPATGKQGVLSLEIIQDATGSRTLTLSSAYDTQGGITTTLSTAASAVDIVRFETRDGGTTIRTYINSDMK